MNKIPFPKSLSANVQLYFLYFWILLSIFPLSHYEVANLTLGQNYFLFPQQNCIYIPHSFILSLTETHILLCQDTKMILLPIDGSQALTQETSG